jgi:group II intron reverse transcriptase/maturase
MASAVEDRRWLLNEQRKLYQRSWTEPDYAFRELWGLITDPHNFRCALRRVAGNRGRRTAGADGKTVRQIIASGPDRFLEQLRLDLRQRSFKPSPVRRVRIPKGDKPGESRPLGIPTVADRVVQAAMKNIMEPIFEAGFYPNSYGFRPGRGVHGALEHLRVLLMPAPRWRPKSERLCSYQIAIEGDIKGCFDNIDHHGLMNRVRQKIADPKLNRLIVAFLKAGILSEGQFLRSETGTPQGGILSPLLANIALGVIEERYERQAWPRQKPTLMTDRGTIRDRSNNNRAKDRRKGKPVIIPIRYADDFILLVSAPPGPNRLERALALAQQEKSNLAQVLKDRLGLELSPTKTLITPVTEPLRFLGHHVRLLKHPSYGWISNAMVPKDRSQRLRERIKSLFDIDTRFTSLQDSLEKLNPILRGWGHFYRFARGAKTVFGDIDHYVWQTIYRWIRKKHPKTPVRYLIARYGFRRPGRRSVDWQDHHCQAFQLSSLKVERFNLAWMRPPSFMATSMESPVRNERRTPGSEEGALETTG